jgi:hypothetical protein
MPSDLGGWELRSFQTTRSRGHVVVRSSHADPKIHASFDDERLVSCAGPAPVSRLAESCGLPALTGELVRVAGPLGANTGAKLASIVAGMVAGADSIDDLDVLRHGAGFEVGERPAGREGEPVAAGRTGGPYPAAARRWDAGVLGHRLDAAARVRAQ